MIPDLPFSAALALLTTFVPAMASAQRPAPDVDALMADYADMTGPGASLLVMRDGEIVHAKGYGLAVVEAVQPVTPETNFRLASLSKQFTAAAVMLLAADGTLAYDDDITTILPDLPGYAKGVTVRQMLQHTSGLPDYELFVDRTRDTQVQDREIPSLISRATSMKFPPGTRYDYSNTGYVLLALIVERLSGERYADFLQTRFFTPLGMRGTVAFEDGRSTVPNRAYGHPSDQSNTSATLGDGGIYSSAADLAKWYRALEEHTLVGADAQRLAYTSPTLPDGTPGGYGFGWFVDEDRGMLRLKHHGETRGFTNAVVRYPDRRLTVVVLSNRIGGDPWDVAQSVADLYLPLR